MPSTLSADRHQKQLLALLEDPASYPHAPECVEVVQTHISYVALVPPFVYKVKKPVDFGFLDFSTLELRKHFCEEEVRLNRRLCAETYEGVVPIRREHDALTFGEAGEIVEYAVKMKHLAEGFFLDQRLERGDLTTEHLDRVVEKLAAFYKAEVPTPELASWGRTERLRISTDENFEQTERYVGALLTRPAFDALRYYTDRFYDQHAALLNRRRAGGHILDCHGDLHLEHIHLSPGGVCIYDCIEFSERLRSIDTANDVASLAMDLDYRGHSGLAAYFARRMAEVRNDPDLHRLIGFYKAYRAYVRAKVESLRSAEAEVPEQERNASRDRAQRYYRLALRYAVARSQPLVVVVMGGVGTGKSTLAEALGGALGWTIVSSDRARKEQAGVPLHRRGSDAERATLYAADRTEATYAALREATLKHATRHRGTILDATYGRRRHREALREALREQDIPYFFVEVTASEEIVRERLRARQQATGVVSDARLEDFEMLTAHYEAPDDLEDARHIRVASEPSADATTLEALKHLIRFDL